MKQVIPAAGPLSGGRGGQPGWHPRADEFKQVENCFLIHNSSIHFCCTDSSLLMNTVMDLFGELEKGGQVSFCDHTNEFQMLIPSLTLK